MSRKAPGYRLKVNGHELTKDVLEQIASVRCQHTWDGADELEVECDAWSARHGRFRIIGETVFQAGNLIELESGYGDLDHSHGRYEVVRHEVSLDPRPRVRIYAYDLMHRLVGPHANQGRAFLETARDSDIAREYARFYGFQADVDDTPENPKYQPTKQKGHKSKRNKDAPLVYPTWIKETGTTDLADLKTLAIRHGYLPPWIRYEDGADVLHFTAPRSLQDQVAASGADGLMLWRHMPTRGVAVDDGAGDCVLREFRPQYTTSGQPVAVRVVGFDETGSVPVVVELELVPGSSRPKVVYEGFVETVADESPSPQQASGNAWLSQLEDRSWGDSAGVMVEVLGQYKSAPVKVNGEETEAQWWQREVLSVGRLQTELSARAYAERWMEARRTMFQQATFAFGMVNGTHRIDSREVYPVIGVSPEYEGYWMVREVTHTWDNGEHRADGVVRRVPSSRKLAEVSG